MKNKDKRYILIAGAPTSGKSTLASELSVKLGLPWISTDQIREIMWGTANKSDFENLFNTHGMSAEDFYTTYTSAQIIDKEITQGKDVWKGVKHFMENDYTWKNGCIIEGVAIIPELVHRDFGDNGQIKMLIVQDKNKDNIRDVVFNRGLWSGAQRYPDSVKEHEVEYVQLFNEWFEEEAEKYSYPVVPLKKDGTDLEEVLKCL